MKDLNADGNTFEEPRLHFRLRKPANWRFLPPAWSPTAQMKNSESFSDTLIRHANLPFCCAIGHHDSTRHVYPTLQVSVRQPLPYSAGLASTLLESQIEAIRKTHDEFALIDANSRAMVAGFPATFIKCNFTLTVKTDEAELVLMPVISRCYVILAASGSFALGLSGSDDPAYYDESSFESILDSVSIGA